MSTCGTTYQDLSEEDITRILWMGWLNRIKQRKIFDRLTKEHFRKMKEAIKR